MFFCCFLSVLLFWCACPETSLSALSATVTQPSLHPHRQHHHTSRTQQWNSAVYPVEVCGDRRYWKPLPNPDSVIGYGYNVMTAHMTTIPIFNTSVYEDRECRLTGRRSPTGTWDMYRLPAHVSSYSFYSESSNQNLKLRFRYSVYNSTAAALLDAKKSRSLPMEVQETTKYHDLYVDLKSAPLRYFSGARTYYEAMEDLALNSRGTRTQKTPIDPAAPVLYSLRASATTGEFELKSKGQLHWRHLDERFRQRLRRAIVDDDFLKGFFDEVGTHYAKGGTFGGVSERWWISRRRPERKCASGEESRILDIALLAACDRFRLGDSDEENDGAKENKGVEVNATGIFSTAQSLATRCHLVFDDERFRTSRWTVTSGAPGERLKAAHTRQSAFSGRSSDAQLQQWLGSLNEEPSTVRVNLAPICDLLSLVDERPWHMERCHERLLDYVKAKDPFSAGKDTKMCSNFELPLKFEKFNQTHVGKSTGRSLAEDKGQARSNASTYQVYCIATSAHPQERTCRSSANAVAKTCFDWILLSISVCKVFC